MAQEALGNMRTVSAFNAQQRTAEKYSEVAPPSKSSHTWINWHKCAQMDYWVIKLTAIPSVECGFVLPQELHAPEGVQKQGGIYQGLIVGSFNSFFMFSYALALW